MLIIVQDQSSHLKSRFLQFGTLHVFFVPFLLEFPLKWRNLIPASQKKTKKKTGPYLRVFILRPIIHTQVKESFITMVTKQERPTILILGSSGRRCSSPEFTETDNLLLSGMVHAAGKPIDGQAMMNQ